MNWEQIESNWKDFAGSARAHWSQLTDADWQTITGNKEQLIKQIETQYGITKDEAAKQVEEWSVALIDIRQPAKGR
jgi:uncharacterized protein YjbJ (UPF0337 family)